MITPAMVTACLVTRGDVDLQPILDTFPYPNVIVWGPEREELHVYGRYAAMHEADTPYVYTQDDDCVFTEHDWLMAAHQPGRITCSWGHTDEPAYEDCALVHGGAIMDRELPVEAFARYAEHWPIDELFLRECDMINGILSPSVQLPIPHEIRMDIATRPNRMCRQPYQREWKFRAANRARMIRDRQMVAA